jgi:hypothetical protein
MQLHLYHGRKTPDEDMDDWGFDGPTLLGVEWMAVTYMSTFRVKFKTVEQAQAAQALTGWEYFADNDQLEIQQNGSLIAADGNYYGDWSLDEET